MMRRAAILALVLAACSGSDDGVRVGSGPSPLMLTVSWSAPTSYADGTPLPASAIAGYRIEYGKSPAALGTVLDVGPVLTRDITTLDAGVYYVTVRTRGTNGEVSAPAGPASGVSRR
jgi:hypothetical protein